MRVRWLERAEADRADVEAYYGQYNLRAAVAAGDRIQQFVDLLEDFPYIGHKSVYPGIREIAVPGSNSVVLYRIQGEEVHVLRIFHGGQRRPARL